MPVTNGGTKAVNKGGSQCSDQPQSFAEVLQPIRGSLATHSCLVHSSMEPVNNGSDTLARSVTIHTRHTADICQSELPPEKRDPTNKRTILSEINQKLYEMGRISEPRAPDVEYIFQEFVMPVGFKNYETGGVDPVGCCDKMSAQLQRVGHALIKYTLPAHCKKGTSRDERQVIVDVCMPGTPKDFDLLEYYGAPVERGLRVLWQSIDGAELTGDVAERQY